MKKYIFVVFYVLVSLYAQAQDPTIMKWGAIDRKELLMTIYPADSNASAVVLGSYGYTYFTYSNGRFQVSYKIHKRIKILNKEGYKYANVEVPLWSTNNNDSKESIAEIQGATYSLNPKSGGIDRTFLEEKNIYTEIASSQKGRQLKIVKFALPDIKEGCIIDYTYSVHSDFIMILNAWEFQEKIPVLKSEYLIKMIDELSYVYVIQSNEPFKDMPDPTSKIAKSNAGLRTYRWLQENIPAFKDESFIANTDDYIGKIQFQLANYTFPNSSTKEIFSTWEKTISELWNDSRYGGFVKRKGATKDLVSSLIIDKNTEKEKLNAIYDYVKENIEAEAYSGIWTQNTPKDLLNKKIGYKHEINLLLVNMLREAGLEANPILLSTRSHGRIYKNYPILERFNYSIAYIKIGEEEILLDATKPMLPIGMLPADVLNGEGLLMDKDGKESRWINLQNRTKSTQMWIAKLHLLEDGLLEGALEMNLQGYEALRQREKYAKLQKEEASEQGKDSKESDKYDSFKDSLENLYDYQKPLKGKSNFKSNFHTEQNGERIYLNPLLDFKMKENPLKAKERKHLIDFAYPFEDTFIMTYFIPNTYQVEELPKSERLQWADKSVRFDYLASVNGNAVQVVCKLIVNRAVFAPNEYQDLKNTFAKIVAKQNEQIVLKKK
jgi:hypothetical protein